jgi:hypothetical protein
LYYIIRMVKSRSVRLEGHLACMGEEKIYIWGFGGKKI